MDNIVKTASIVVFLILFVHVFLLMLHNAFRIIKLLKYIDKFKNEGKLNENDYQLLYDRYFSAI
jgi:hypothetical protein